MESVTETPVEQTGIGEKMGYTQVVNPRFLRQQGTCMHERSGYYRSSLWEMWVTWK